LAELPILEAREDRGGTWDHRLRIDPDGDLFTASAEDRADVVTQEIDRLCRRDYDCARAAYWRRMRSWSPPVWPFGQRVASPSRWTVEA